jgi:predicted O-methyltransferase YrrM
MKLLRQFFKNMIPFVTKGDLANHYRQMESLIGVYNQLNYGYSFGQLRGWAISPDSLGHVLKIITSYERPLVVEFGSGQSTIAISKLLTAHSGSLISVEHGADYYSNIHGFLKSFGFDKVVNSIIAPLEQHSPNLISYQMNLMPKVSPNVVIVDGPPGKGRSRFPPLEWAYTYLADDGVVLLDDYIRDDEKQCVLELKEKFPLAIVEELRAEKGLAAIRKPSIK